MCETGENKQENVPRSVLSQDEEWKFEPRLSVDIADLMREIRETLRDFSEDPDSMDLYVAIESPLISLEQMLEHAKRMEAKLEELPEEMK